MVDRDPIRRWMAGLNAGAVVRTEAVEVTEIDHALVHLDPARRDESSGRRSWRIEDLVPNLDSIRGILARAEGGAVKLGLVSPDRRPNCMHVSHSRSSRSMGVWCRRWCGRAGLLARNRAKPWISLRPDTVRFARRLHRRRRTRRSAPDVSSFDRAARTRPVALEAAMGGDAALAGEPAVGLGLVTVPLEVIDSVSSKWFRAVRILEVLSAEARCRGLGVANPFRRRDR